MGYGSNTDAFFFVILVRGKSPYKTSALFFPGADFSRTSSFCSYPQNLWITVALILRTRLL
ncbi:hypothetical protein D3K18_22195 [Escherichia coli]|nr:hypothetical protein [Escherichia coli]EFC2210028.1 hypothetical protein [Escherichia coli]EFE7896566.1 hypothetical protein [Escherichia coli]EFN9561174.1 hypothetical protein [Escherichia coli]